jgi:hypothetical protein
VSHIPPFAGDDCFIPHFWHVPISISFILKTGDSIDSVVIL